MRVGSLHRASIAAAVLLASASVLNADVVFQDTFNYPTSAALIDPLVGGWVPFNANPTITTDYVVSASGSGYISANHLPPVQSGYTLMSANNRGAYHDLPETLTSGWTVSVSMLLTAYSRSASVGLMDSTGANGYGFSLNTSNPGSFNGKGFATLRKIDSWVTAAFTATQGTQLGANAGGVAYPNGFELPPGGPFNTTDGIPYAPDAPFLGFTTFDLSWTPSGVLTLSQDGTPLRTFTDTSFTSFSRVYYGSGSVGFVDNITVSKNLVSNSASWNVDADGNWSTAANWTGNVIPNAVGALASFGSIATATRTVTVDAPHTVGGLDFSSGQAFVIAGPGTLTLDSTSGAAVVNVGGGAHTISAPISLNDNLSITVQGGTSVNFSGGVTSNGKSIAKFGSGNAQFPNVRTPDLNANSGIVRVTATPTANVDEGTSRVESLTVAATGKLDLNNNALVLDYAGATPIATIRTLLASAYAVGSWAGATGIGSTSAATAAADPLVTKKTAIGYGEASSLGLTSLGGQSFTGDAILFRYAVYGDANLDGTIGFQDLVRLAQNYNGSNKTWAEGDFNYDGHVDFTDLVSLAQNYNLSLATVDGASPEFAADWALVQSLLPEPVSLSLLLPAARLLARRRR